MRVTFCGHSQLYGDPEIENRLKNEIEELILKGADEFFLGGYGQFDNLCAKCLKTLKEIYPHIKSVLVIPYLEKSYPTFLYDETLYPPLEDVPKRFAIVKRNEYMVEKSDVIISYVTRTYGGAYSTLNYAKRKKKTIINLYPIW